MGGGDGGDAGGRVFAILYITRMCKGIYNQVERLLR